MGKLKKALAVLSIVAFSANTFGQLTMESAKTHEEIYVYKFGGITTTEIIDIESTIFLMTRSSNQFERSFFSIYLGETKEEVLASLDDLERLKKECPKDGVKVQGLNCTTTLYPYSGLCAGGGVAIFSDGIAGYGLFGSLTIKTKKAKEKIEEYFQSKE